jgi:hypothetical protein
VSILHSLELTGPIGSILAQTQYYMLDRATARLFSLATNLTEPFVVSVPPAALVAWCNRFAVSADAAPRVALQPTKSSRLR